MLPILELYLSDIFYMHCARDCNSCLLYGGYFEFAHVCLSVFSCQQDHYQKIWISFHEFLDQGELAVVFVVVTYVTYPWSKRANSAIHWPLSK